jgi:phospholipase/carboxylesterase
MTKLSAPKLSGPMLPPASGAAPTKLVVLLHGYGDDGAGLIGLGRYWSPLLPNALFVSPNAPSVCGAFAGGFEWFPLANDQSLPWSEGVRLAAPVLRVFLADLWAQTGLTAADTVLAGFSQGAMMALHVGTGLDERLAGIIGFSGAFLPSDAFAAGIAAKPPVALVHGAEDTVLEAQHSRNAAEELATAGFEVTLHITPGSGHTISDEGLAFASAFLLASNG